MPKLSVTVITRNEATDIGLALQSVAWADELVVVDSLSTALEIEDQFRISLPELHQAWSATLPRLFG